MLRAALLVLGKELRATVRDPHVLAYLLFPILLYPGMLLGTVGLMSYRDGVLEHESWTLQVEAPADVADVLLEGNTAGDGGAEALADGRLDAIVTVTTGSEGRLDVVVEHVSTRSRSTSAAAQVLDRLEELEDQRYDDLLQARGMDREDLPTIEVGRKVRGDRGQGLARWFGAIILCVVVPASMLVAGVYPAVELIVSERERGTLETTLVAPVSRPALLAGKVGACMILMLGAGLGNAAALALTANQLVFVATEKLDQLWIPPLATLLTLPPLIACALLFSGVYLVCVLPARTFKEGEYVATLGTFVLLAPLMGGLFLVTTDTTSPAFAAVPVCNAVVAMYWTLQGTFAPGWLLMATLENAVLGAALIALGAWVLDREDTLFADRLPRWLAWTRNWMPE